jgi:hypothetical protein
MKHIYTPFRKPFRIFSLVGLMSVSTASFAQNSTDITKSFNCGTIIADFNEDNGLYTSPSIYESARDDKAFYYKKSQGWWTEMGEDGRIRPIPSVPRTVSIVSLEYPSPARPGNLDVGFTYVVPDPNLDMFNITVTRLTERDGFTFPEFVGGSEDQLFKDYSSAPPTPYIDSQYPTQNGMKGAICIRLTDVDFTIGSNIKYRITVSYRIKSGGSHTIFDDFTLNDMEEGSLPVNFVGIVAKKTSEGGVQVRWDVADETDVKEYQIERSADGTNYSVIGSVPANKSHVYSFMDGRPIPGAAYYRVKNIDNDKKFKYSSVIKLYGSGTSYSSTLRAYPTPAREQVTIEHRKLNKDATISVSTVDGRILKTVRPANGASHTPIVIADLPKGVYIVRLVDGENAPETSKLIKQ